MMASRGLTISRIRNGFDADVVFALPGQCYLEPGHAGELAVQALDHALDPHALEMRVAGR